MANPIAPKFFLTQHQRQAIRENLLDPIFRNSQIPNIERFYLKFLTKFDSEFTSEAVEKLSKTLGSQSIERLQLAHSNPARFSTEFGIDPQNQTQLKAAKIYIQSALVTQNDRVYSAENIDRQYLAKLSQYRDKDFLPELSELEARQLSRKYKLLLTTDPIIAVLPPKPTNIETILHHTYFETSSFEYLTVTSNSAGIQTSTVKKIEVSRELSAQIIRTIIDSLHRDPNTGWAVECYASHLAKTQKGSIYIGAHPLGNPFAVNYNGAAPSGAFYNGRKSIFSNGFINPLNPDPEGKHSSASSALLHEIMHYLINHCFGNATSPTRNLAEDKEFNTILKNDRDYRHRTKFTEEENQALEPIQCDLENSKGYFPGGFNENNQAHLKIMRVEMSVKVMELLALGHSPETIEKIAPHLYEYFNSKIKPELIDHFRKKLEAPDSKENSKSNSTLLSQE